MRPAFSRPGPPELFFTVRLNLFYQGTVFEGTHLVPFPKSLRMVRANGYLVADHDLAPVGMFSSPF